MVEKSQTIATPSAGASPNSNPTGAPVANAPPANRRGPGNRGADMRDAMAELAERALVISQETGSKVGAAIRDVVSAAAGVAGFEIESARDVLQYMVRRAQMSQEEADRLIREAEVAHAKRPASERNRPTATKVAAERAATARADHAARLAAAAAAMSYPSPIPAAPTGKAPSIKPGLAPPSSREKGERLEKKAAVKTAAKPAAPKPALSTRAKATKKQSNNTKKVTKPAKGRAKH
ncbi:MAG TPA: hypothetical protein VMH39_04080 [Gemmatimonadaceae bacterium]|nr:hypothetical protein [Gemmatimonadaceae bacterium]